MQLPHPAQHPVPAHAAAQRQQAMSSAVAVVIVAGFGLAALSVGDWRPRILCAAVALAAFVGQRVFQKYPNLLSMAGVGYTGFTLLMVAGVLTALIFCSADVGSLPDAPGFLFVMLLAGGVFICREAQWRLGFMFKYGIFASCALIGSLVLSIDLSKIEALPQAPATRTSASTTDAHTQLVESLRTLAVGVTDIPAVVWSPDNRSLARATHNAVSILDAHSGQTRLAVNPRARGLSALAWSPDGHTLAIGSLAGTIELWDTDTGRWQVTLEQSGGVMALAWNPTGSSLASANSDDSVVLWYGWGASRSTLEHAARIRALAWEPEGRFLAGASWDNTIKLWDTGSGQLIAQSDGASAGISQLAWSPDGNTLVSASGADNKITLWDVNARRTIRKVRTFDAQKTAVTNLAWNPYGTMLAEATGDQSVTIWDTVKWIEWRTVSVPTRHIQAIAWSPDGKELAINTTEALRMWDVR
jgi:WD40 repeat protein